MGGVVLLLSQVSLRSSFCHHGCMCLLLLFCEACSILPSIHPIHPFVYSWDVTYVCFFGLVFVCSSVNVDGEMGFGASCSEKALPYSLWWGCFVV
jgi:hypothetical protein